MSAWKEYKAKLGETRPWHLLNMNEPRVSEQDANSRYDICLDCDRLTSATKQCKECGCIMPVKVKLEKATCPLGKW
jgi:hypothetical protein